MGLKLSAGLGLALLVLSGAFKLYYDKSQAEIESFHLRLEQSIQNQKTLEGTVDQQNKNLKQAVENQELMVAQVEKLTKENMVAQPKLIEGIINRGTKAVLNDLKVITDETQFDEDINIPTPTAG